MVFTETAMHVLLASIINRRPVVISVVVVAVSIVIITKHGVRPVTVVVPIPVHHRRRRSSSIRISPRVTTTTIVSLHGHLLLLLLRVVVVTHGGRIGIVSPTIVCSSVTVNRWRSGSALVLKRQKMNITNCQIFKSPLLTIPLLSQCCC